MIRKAKAVWRGTGRAGNGELSTDSGVLTDTPYSFRTRFENEKGTNPEELIAAAHAGCFTMALAFGLQAAGFTPTELTTEAAVMGLIGELSRSRGMATLLVTHNLPLAAAHCHRIAVMHAGQIVEHIPMHRLGTPDEVAKIIYVLCTDTASFVNGAEIHINGGQHV